MGDAQPAATAVQATPLERAVTSAVETLLSRQYDSRSGGTQERRRHFRDRYAGPVEVRSAGSQELLGTGFATDISVSGIGFVHQQLIPTEPVEITLFDDSDNPTRLRAEIIYCRPYGRNWYRSGAVFLDAAE